MALLGPVAGPRYWCGGADQRRQPGIQSATFQPIATLTTVAITYLFLTTLVTQISNAVEYRF